MNSTAERSGLSDRVDLTEDWSLWRDFAVRSSGFPVEGLETFGPDESRSRRRGARSGLPRGGGVAEPRVTQARGGQACGRHAGQPLAPAPMDGRRRQLLA